MDKTKLLYDLAASLQKISDTEELTSMLEYCQGELRVLLYLNRRDGTAVCPSELSESLDVTRQRITSILTSLRKKGFVNMEIAEDDRRKMLVRLTDAGREYYKTKETRILGDFNVLIDGLGEQNTLELTRLINLAKDQFEAYKKNKPL